MFCFFVYRSTAYLKESIDDFQQMPMNLMKKICEVLGGIMKKIRNHMPAMSHRLPMFVHSCFSVKAEFYNKEETIRLDSTTISFAPHSSLHLNT